VAERLLLDSHVFLWWRADDSKLKRRIRAVITDAVDVYVSSASTWEIGLKVALGKLSIPEPVEDGVLDSGFLPLPITFEHTRAAGSLPPHHADPFDRMLIGQALVEGLTLVTHDSVFDAYAVPLLKA
jgi:PIN domain nuclease of toxin-antitoxin system